MVRPDHLVEIGRRFPDAIAVAIHAEEASGLNKLPVLYARAIGDVAGIAVDEFVVQSNRTFHTGATARQRLARRPRFTGPVLPDREYVLVDDVVTSGCSLAALRHYLEARGGKVVLATTLSAAEARHGFVPTRLPVTAESAAKLRRKFSDPILNDILRDHGIAPTIDHVTESEARALLGFESVDAVRSSLVAARQAEHRP